VIDVCNTKVVTDWEEARKSGAAGYYEQDPGAEAHLLGPQLRIYTPATMRVFRVVGEAFDLDFRVESHEGRLIARSVAVRSFNGEPITATVWRQVNIIRVWREAIMHQVLVTPDPNHDDAERAVRFGYGLSLPDETLDLLRAKGPVRETLEVVANVYSLGRALDLQPVKYLMDFFRGESLSPLPRTTATGWVKKARELGLIDGTGGR